MISTTARRAIFMLTPLATSTTTKFSSTRFTLPYIPADVTTLSPFLSDAAARHGPFAASAAVGLP